MHNLRNTNYRSRRTCTFLFCVLWDNLLLLELSADSFVVSGVCFVKQHMNYTNARL